MPAVVTLVVLGLTVGPTGFYQFCANQPGQCVAVVGTTPTVAMANAVNRKVNASIRPFAETGGADVWRIGDVTGDCEDYALTKRATLIRAGVASSAARVAAGWADNGERHAVLVVTTRAGDFVLDNMTNEILPIGRAHIQIDKIQSADNPRIWRAVRG